MMKKAPVIVADGLSKRFGDTTVVADVGFSVGAGEVLGLLGPNGAGKTTIVKMLTTLLRPDGGTASVAGFDVVTQGNNVRASIGLAGQAAAVDDKLTAYENLDLVGRLYHLGRVERRRKVAELVDRFRLGEFADRPVETYSGGQKRRLDLVASLVADPVALFLDEPTTGLDPRSRAEIWEVVRELARSGTAVLLTTQYLEEADSLADRMVLIDQGCQIAEGSSAELKQAFGSERLEVTVNSRSDADQVLALITQARITDRAGHVATESVTIEVLLKNSLEALDTLARIQRAGVIVADFDLHSPTLDEVFLSLTGAEVER